MNTKKEPSGGLDVLKILNLMASLSTDAVERGDVEFAEVLLAESDRGCLLVGFCYLEEAVEMLLEVHFRMNSDIKKGELDRLMLDKRRYPPLGSVAVQVRVAHAVGVIDRDLMELLDEIRNSRNKLAHKYPRFSFSEEFIGDLNAKVPESLKDGCDHLEQWISEDVALDPLRCRFIAVCTMARFYIRSLATGMKQG